MINNFKAKLLDFILVHIGIYSIESSFYIIEIDFCSRCPPCRGFTPMLIDFYKHHSKEKNFEFIFISSDRDERAFNEYYKEMPWLALEYSERKKKEELAKLFQITGIPTILLLDGDSANIICTDARDYIQHRDQRGEHFPWKSL